MTLLSDGNKVFAASSPDEVIDLLARGQGVFALAVDKVWNDVEGSVRKQTAKAARARGA
jgi:hypothetical protein